MLREADPAHLAAAREVFADPSKKRTKPVSALLRPEDADVPSDCNHKTGAKQVTLPNDFGKMWGESVRMGGPGSGSWYRWSKKNTVEECRTLDINRWSREGLLRPGLYFSWAWKDDQGSVKASIEVRTLPGAVELAYTVTPRGGEPQEIRYQVPLTYTPCNYGGERPWFVCPGKGCGRRVGKLYLGGTYFLCRHCHDLAYESQREDRATRFLRKAQKIRRQLGGHPGLVYPFPEKPKGMHWKTYYRLKFEAEKAEWASWAALQERLERWQASLQRAEEKLKGLERRQQKWA